MPRDDLIALVWDLEPLGASLALWADGDEPDLEANLDEDLGMPPLGDLDLECLEL